MYGATLLSDNSSIIYMGGFSSVETITMNQVHIYDTINDNWSTKTTLGKIPSGRAGLSAVLGLDGQRVIVYGGTPGNTNYGDLALKDSIYELNLINYEWRIPITSGNIPKRRGYNPSIESDILLLDISDVNNYIWTNEFDLPTSIPSPTTEEPTQPPSSSSSSSPPPSSSNEVTDVSSQPPQPKSTVMIGAIIGSVFGGPLLFFAGFFLYRWNKKKKNSYKNHYNDNQYDHGHVIVQQPKNEYETNHQPKNNKSGQKSTSTTTNDEKLTLQELQQEIQDLKQIILHTSKQSTSSMRNN
ncbi:hypothetical protein RclHR1_05920008 [Rhizophagus clarus]|uniref:Galactose oxidase n=1 Tax=Rhizophagus clarus TaxID=94130 RepID=A0A2Z6RPC2_9GLOM|nr:hypothetical protein RclHR1_05920008 [Rhizophagus clarus]